MSDSIDVIEVGQEFLGKVFERLSVEIDIQGKTEDDNGLVYELSGGTTSLRSRPDLVSALTLITSQVVSRHVERRINCVLDIDGQLESRRLLLETAADDVARAVTVNGRRAVFEGLNSSERRIIHTQLKEDPTVRTFSEGNDRNRLLLVEADSDA